VAEAIAGLTARLDQLAARQEPAPDNAGIVASVDRLSARLDALHDRLDSVVDASAAPLPDVVEMQEKLRHELIALRRDLSRRAPGVDAAAAPFDSDLLLDQIEQRLVRQLGSIQLILDDLRKPSAPPAPTRADREAGTDRIIEALRPYLEGMRRLPIPNFDPLKANHADELVRIPYSAQWMERLKAWLQRVDPPAGGLISNSAIAILYATSFETWLDRHTAGQLDDKAEITIYERDQGEGRHVESATSLQTRDIRIQLIRRKYRRPIDQLLERRFEDMAHRGVQLDALLDAIDAVLQLRRSPAHEAEEVTPEHVEQLRQYVLHWVDRYPAPPRRPSAD
jgi:hypothetical protein